MQKNNNLTIAIIQTDIIWEKPTDNRKVLENKIRKLNAETELVVLPEMFTTGFTMQAEKFAETMDGKTLSWLQNLSSELQIAITGSLIITENGNYYNRLVFVHPDGGINYYDKRHSFTLANEHKTYTSGENKIIVSYKGWEISPLICYDLRFPVWARNIENYDLLIYVANWPEKRIYAWNSLLKARAIENMSYTIGVNRLGIDKNELTYNGNSIALDFEGKSISETNNSSEEIIYQTLDIKAQNNFRKRFNFLNDKDDFIIK